MAPATALTEAFWGRSEQDKGKNSDGYPSESGYGHLLSDGRRPAEDAHGFRTALQVNTFLFGCNCIRPSQATFSCEFVYVMDRCATKHGGVHLKQNAAVAAYLYCCCACLHDMSHSYSLAMLSRLNRSAAFAGLRSFGNVEQCG